MHHLQVVCMYMYKIPSHPRVRNLILFHNIWIFTTDCSCNQATDVRMTITHCILYMYIMKCNIFQMLSIVNVWFAINMVELIKIGLLS